MSLNCHREKLHLLPGQPGLWCVAELCKFQNWIEKNTNSLAGKTAPLSVLYLCIYLLACYRQSKAFLFYVLLMLGPVLRLFYILACKWSKYNSIWHLKRWFLFIQQITWHETYVGFIWSICPYSLRAERSVQHSSAMSLDQHQHPCLKVTPHENTNSGLCVGPREEGQGHFCLLKKTTKQMRINYVWCLATVCFAAYWCWVICGLCNKIWPVKTSQH